jgi:hypothetical protein
MNVAPLFGATLIRPTSKWSSEHVDALRVRIEEATLARILPQNEGFVTDRAIDSAVELQKAFGRINRNLLRERPSQINLKLKEQDVSKVSAFALSLAKVVQIPWRPVELLRDRSRRQGVVEGDVEMADDLSDSEASEQSSTSSSEGSQGSQGSQGSNYSMMDHEIIQGREGLECLTLQLATHYLERILLEYHQEVPASIWELALSYGSSLAYLCHWISLLTHTSFRPQPYSFKIAVGGHSIVSINDGIWAPMVDNNGSNTLLLPLSPLIVLEVSINL